MFFGFQLTLGLMMAFYGFSVMKNPRVWGDQGRRAVKAENFEEYCRQNGQFFLKAGCVVAVIGALDALITLDALLYALLYIFGLAFAFYPLTRWCKQNEGFSWPWPLPVTPLNVTGSCFSLLLDKWALTRRPSGRSSAP